MDQTGIAATLAQGVQVDPDKPLDIVAPGTVRGFASARSASALPDGVMALLNDVRLDSGVVAVRNGGQTIDAAINGTQTVRGAYACLLNGAQTLFAATSDGTHVSVLASTNGGTSWTNVSPTSGAYGDTRLSDAGPVFFALASYQSQDYLVIQNGADAPRYYDGTTMRTVPTLDPTGYAVAVSYDLGTGTVFASNPTVVNSDDGPSSEFLGEIKSLGTGCFLSIYADPQISASERYITVGPLSDPLVTPAYDASAGQQIAMALDAGTLPTKTTDDQTSGTATIDERWRSLLIEGSVDGTTWFALYDPSKTPLIAVVGTGTNYLAAFPLTTDNAAKTISYVRFSYPDKFGRDADPDIYLKVYAIKNSGPEAGGTAYAAAFGKPGTTDASPPVRSGGVVGGVATGATYGGVQIPLSGAIGYVYTVQITAPTGVSSVPTYLYRNDLGTDGYFYLATFTGPGSHADTGGDLDYTLPLPPASAVSIPVGTSMASVNDRLMVCGGKRFWYSAVANPFQFTQLVQTDGDGNADPTSGGSFSRPGETFQAVLAVGQVLTGAETFGTPQSGAVGLYVLSDQATLVLSGFDALSLNKATAICAGTRSPLSVARGLSGGFTFLDAHGQVRRVDGTSSSALSKFVVDDQTKAIPASRLPWVYGVEVDERYYMAYTPSGSTNARILVYNEALPGFESIDRPESPAQALVPLFDATLARTRLLQFTTVGLVEHGVPGRTTEPSGNPVAAKIVGPEISYAPTAAIFGKGTIVTDADPSGTATMSVACLEGDFTPSVSYSSVSLVARTLGDTRVAARTDVGVGGSTLAAQPSLTLSCSGGTRLYRWSLDAKPGNDATQP